MNFKHFLLLFLAITALSVVSCKDDESRHILDVPNNNQEDDDVTDEMLKYSHINTFAYNTMNQYYLWVDEPQVDEKMKNWALYDDPIAIVKDVRFKDETGKDIDRWTSMLTNFDEAEKSLDGVVTTYGFDFSLYMWDDDNVCAIVNYVMKGGPAEKAGLKRGDVIVKVNGKLMPFADKKYSDIVNNELLGGKTLVATMEDDSQITLNAVVLQEDAILLTKVFDVADKKVGYMVYNSFTFESIDHLIEECKKFKKAGISELILDLRYNGGGYGIAKEALASMLGPEAEVKAGSLLEVMVYNDYITEYYKSKNIKNDTYFSTEFSYESGKEEKVSNTADANIGIEKLYVIVTDNSASASEALICCLKPYMPVILIGEQTYGKYCGGFVIGAQNFYENNKKHFEELGTYKEAHAAVKNWGIYVMASRYADKNGQTGCMPDGYRPDIEATDKPYDGYQLGDPEESMLKVALTQVGYKFASTRTSQEQISMKSVGKSEQVRKKTFGMLVL